MIIVYTALGLVVLSYLIEQYRPIKDGKVADTDILLMRFVHYSVTIAISFYVFVFDKSYDKLYFFAIALVTLHWLFNQMNCILDTIESRYYETEETKLYMSVLFGRLTDIVLLSIGLLMWYGFLVVLNRQNISSRVVIMIMVVVTFYMLFVICSKHYLKKTVVHI